MAEDNNKRKRIPKWYLITNIIILILVMFFINADQFNNMGFRILNPIIIKALITVWAILLFIIPLFNFFFVIYLLAKKYQYISIIPFLLYILQILFLLFVDGDGQSPFYPSIIIITCIGINLFFLWKED